jgi:hypothetical protein
MTTTRTLHLVPDLKTASTIKREQHYSPRGEVGRHMSKAQGLKHQIDELTTELDSERSWLLNHMETKALDRIECGELQVQRRTYHKWTYSPALMREMLKIKNDQKWEQSHGEAMDSPTIGISFVIKPPKS